MSERETAADGAAPAEALAPLPGEGERRDRPGHLHPTSRAVVEALGPEVAELLAWLGRDLDASADFDDAVQTLALAQLEAQAAAPGRTGLALVRAVDRRARRAIWPMRSTRGQAHRTPWLPERIQLLAGPEADPAVMEGLGWDEIVRLLGWQDGLLLWLSAVEGWSLSELGAWYAVTKQQAWRRVQAAQAALRAQLRPRAG